MQVRVAHHAVERLVVFGRHDETLPTRKERFKTGNGRKKFLPPLGQDFIELGFRQVLPKALALGGRLHLHELQVDARRECRQLILDGFGRRFRQPLDEAFAALPDFGKRIKLLIEPQAQLLPP